MINATQRGSWCSASPPHVSEAHGLSAGADFVIDPAGSAIGQGILSTPGCGELINLGMLVSGWKWLAIFEFASGACER